MVTNGQEIHITQPVDVADASERTDKKNGESVHML
jgi:hypothetical protein